MFTTAGRPVALILAAAFTVLVFPFTTAVATVLEVPGDYSTIAAALAVVGAGDTVAVSPGTYHEGNLTLPPGVCLRSISNDPANTSIDAGGASTACSVRNGTGSTTRVEGIGFQNYAALGFDAEFTHGASLRKCAFFGGGPHLPGSIGVSVRPCFHGVCFQRELRRWPHGP